jgi:acyl carrier protein
VTEHPDFLPMRDRVVSAVMANPSAVPSPDLIARMDDPAEDPSFEELGFDSLARMEFCIFMECEFGIALTSGDLESHASVNAMAAYLAGGAAA